MRKIGLMSDTHSYLHPLVFTHFKDCDEIWHAGDFGAPELVQQLKDFKPLRGVYGNIDGNPIRTEFPEKLVFTCKNMPVLMTHIGGYPGRYAPGIKQWLKENKAGLFISGHSHILKIQFDASINCLHMNPGAAGKQGWQKVSTLIRFEMHDKDIRNCEVIELPKT